MTSNLSTYTKRHKVAVIGSGNWGSAIAKIVAENVSAHQDIFEPEVQMWVYEETVTIPPTSALYDPSSPLCTSPSKLTSIINHFHENVKYLPSIRLPTNVIANPSLISTTATATILIFNLPHQFIDGICAQMAGHHLPYARGISCIKGVSVTETSVKLFSESIGEKLGIYVGALSGANIATEVAQEKFSETTIAYDPPAVDSRQPTPSGSHEDLTKLSSSSSTTTAKTDGKSKTRLQPLPPDYPPLDHALFKTLFHRPYFHVGMVSDVAGVSLGGALKNIIALAAGFVEGLGWGDNAKAAIMRIGLLEMVHFGQLFFAGSFNRQTFTEESCGVADLITSCSGGRNARCARLSVERGISVDEVERLELNGQKLQGTLTAREVNAWLRSKGKEGEFPLMTAVYLIVEGRKEAKDLPALIG